MDRRPDHGHGLVSPLNLRSWQVLVWSGSGLFPVTRPDLQTLVDALGWTRMMTSQLGKHSQLASVLLLVDRSAEMRHNGWKWWIEMSYMASIYGITRYEPWELIQMQMTEGQGHLVQHTPTTEGVCNGHQKEWMKCVTKIKIKIIKVSQKRSEDERSTPIENGIWENGGTPILKEIGK